MNKILLSLMLSCVILALTLPGFSQPMSNTDNVITLNNTCINAGVSNGTYNLELNYYDLDANASQTKTFTGVTVAINGGVMTITAPSGSFPSVATNGWWSLPDAWPGHIKLTSGSFSTIMFWYQDPDGTTGINCVALPVWFNSFTGSASGGQVTLHWQTGLEQNSTYIEIYRAPGNGNYYKIGQVTAAGNSSNPVNYSFTDPSPCSTNTYYLKILNSQGTLPISSGYLPVSCSGCICSPPSPVFCNFTIIGPDHICNMETATAYSLSSPLPNYSTIAWSVDQSYLASLRTYPEWDPAKVTLLKKNYADGITLTATISGCTNTISKIIALGTPYPVWRPDISCPNVTLTGLEMPAATNITWTVEDVTTGASQSYPGWGSDFQYNIGSGDTYAFGLQYTNGCGTSDYYQVSGYYCIQCANPPCDQSQTVIPKPGNGAASNTMAQTTTGSQAITSVSPNPTNGIVRISLAQTSVSTGNMPTAAASKGYQLRVVDVLGVVRKKLSCPGGLATIQVDLSGLTNGVYLIQVFDNKTWKSTKVILAK